MRRTQCEQMWSGLHPKADFDGSTGDVADGPQADSCAAAKQQIRFMNALLLFSPGSRTVAPPPMDHRGVMPKSEEPSDEPNP